MATKLHLWVFVASLVVFGVNGAEISGGNATTPACIRRQSPINIANSVLASFDDFIWSYEYSIMPKTMVAKNDGETIKVYCTFPGGRKPTIRGGPLLSSYSLDHFHFHWANGSEHRMFNNSYPFELHAVHMRTDKNTNVGDEVSDLLVLGYFFQVSSRTNLWIQSIANVLPLVDKPNSQANIQRIYPLDYLLNKFSDDYYTYDGSLTTPPYTEAVRWVVRKTPLNLSEKQLQQFSALKKSSPDTGHNTRATQPLNGRIVFYANPI